MITEGNAGAGIEAAENGVELAYQALLDALTSDHRFVKITLPEDYIYVIMVQLFIVFECFVYRIEL
jgi:hypothetical protein